MTVWDYICENAIAISALIISICGTVGGLLYTRKSIRAPTLLEARKGHTRELIEFLEEWGRTLPSIDSADIPRREPPPPRDLSRMWGDFSRIKGDWRYNDLINNHLPEECKELSAMWEEYLSSLDEYKKSRHQLYEKIKEDVIVQTGLPYVGDKVEVGVRGSFVDYAYQQAVYWVTAKRLIWDTIKCQEQDNELRFQRSLLAAGTSEELNKAKETFKKMMQERAYLEKYKDEIAAIAEKEKN